MNRPEAEIAAINPSWLPIDTPPSPNLDLNANLNPRVVGVAAFLFVISFFVVSLRFVGRYLSKAGIWWDDWMCLAAMLVAWGTCILCFISPKYNFGRHEAVLGLVDAIEDSEQFFQALYAYETLYTIAVTLAKFSIILFYARIFTEKLFRRALWVVSGLILTWYIAIQIVQLVQCRPLSSFWNGRYAEDCIDVVRMFVIAGAVNCVFNFILLVMPLPMVWGLEITTKAKIGLSLTFLLGIFVFAVSAARLAIIQRLGFVDVTWTYVDAAIWTTVEPNIAVVSASLPILRSLWILFNPQRSIRNSTHDRSLRKTGPKTGGNTEKTVMFADEIEPSALPDNRRDTRDSSLLRSISTRTKASVHHNTPVSSTFRGNEIVSPVYDGGYNAGYMSPGGISAISSSPVIGGSVSRKPTVSGRSESSITPLNSASELSAHRSIPYGGADYARYTVNVSSDSGLQRTLSEKPSIASRMMSLSPKLGGSSPNTRATSRRSSMSEGASIELSKLPIQGGRTPSPGPKGPVKIERVDRSSLMLAGNQGRTRYGRASNSSSLTGHPPVAELYA